MSTHAGYIISENHKEVKKKSSELIDMHNRISTEELNRLVRHQLKQIFDHSELAEMLPPLMICGAPDIVKAIWENRQPVSLTLDKLCRGIPDSREEQRKIFGKTGCRARIN